MERDQASKFINDLLKLMVSRNGSDLFITAEFPPAIKVDAVRRLGGQVVLSGESFSDAWQHTLDLIKESGCIYIPPFDDPDVIAGQGTIGLEIMDDLPDVDTAVL